MFQAFFMRFLTLSEMISLLRRYENNLNQLMRRVHETDWSYDTGPEELRQNYDGLWGYRQLHRDLAGKIQ